MTIGVSFDFGYACMVFGEWTRKWVRERGLCDQSCFPIIGGVSCVCYNTKKWWAVLTNECGVCQCMFASIIGSKGRVTLCLNICQWVTCVLRYSIREPHRNRWCWSAVARVEACTYVDVAESGWWVNKYSGSPLSVLTSRVYYDCESEVQTMKWLYHFVNDLCGEPTMHSLHPRYQATALKRRVLNTWHLHWRISTSCGSWICVVSSNQEIHIVFWHHVWVVPGKSSQYLASRVDHDTHHREIWVGHYWPQLQIYCNGAIASF